MGGASDGRARAPRAPFPRVDIPEGTAVAVAAKETITPMNVKGEEPVKDALLTYAQWIWHPVNPRAQGKVTFRTKIDSSSAAEANMVFACDNAAAVCVNGREVAKQIAGEAPSYNGWRTPTAVKFPLKAGVNDIEVLADNVIPGFAGFVAAIQWPGGVLRTSPDATSDHAATSDWTVERAGEAPVQPIAICRYGGGVWKKLGQSGRITASPFAESVATACSFTLPELKNGERVYFACDDVAGERSAAMTVNGAYAGGFIGAPYRLDITKSVKAGVNTLEAKPFRLKNPRIVIQRSEKAK